MNQPEQKPNTTPDGQLACSFGEPWGGDHPICDAYEPPEALKKIAKTRRATKKVAA